MRYRQLGRSGLFVSEICLGAMTFGGGSGGIWSMIGDLDQQAVNAVMSQALRAGVNFIDTADVYSQGVSERLGGQSLKDLGVKRSDVIVATKVYGDMGNGPNDRGASRGHIMDGVQASLERLGLDHIDLYQIHGNDAVTPLDETLRALDDLVRAGPGALHRLLQLAGLEDRQGAGHRRPRAAGRASRPCRPTTHRRARPGARDRADDGGGRLGLMVWSPLAGGLLSGKFESRAAGPQGARRTSFDFPPMDKERAWPIIDAMREVAEPHDVSVARVALAWLLAKPFVTRSSSARATPSSWRTTSRPPTSPSPTPSSPSWTRSPSCPRIPRLDAHPPGQQPHAEGVREGLAPHRPPPAGACLRFAAVATGDVCRPRKDTCATLPSVKRSSGR